MRGAFFFLLVAVLAPHAALAAGEPNPAHRSRHPEFITPSGLRSRVNFWKDIFTRYGKHEVVLHHREYPQVVFRVLDFRRAADAMNPVALEAYKKRVVADRTALVLRSFERLADGRPESDNALDSRIAEQMKMIPGGREKYQRVLTDDLVRSQTGIKERYAEAVRRSNRYLPIMERIFVREYQLPVELTRIPFIESSFDYQAYSSVGAAGIWQFMKTTGRIYLTVNKFIDERRDPIEATKAAARYLASAYSKIGTWPLAITSYNHGVAGVIRKAREMGTTDITTLLEHPRKRVFGFASGNFYPEFLAALEVFDDYHLHFPGLELEAPLEVQAVRLSQPLSVSHVVKQLNVSAEELRKVNYAVSDAVWSGKARIPAGYALKIPSRYQSAIARLKMPEVVLTSSEPLPERSDPTSQLHVVKRGESLGTIAKQYNMTVKGLKLLNGLASNSLQPGQRVKISPSSASAEPLPTRAAVKSGRFYTVRSGDSLLKISRATGVSVDTIRKANGLGREGIFVGQRLAIP